MRSAGGDSVSASASPPIERCTYIGLACQGCSGLSLVFWEQTTCLGCIRRANAVCIFSVVSAPVCGNGKEFATAGESTTRRICRSLGKTRGRL